MPCGLSKEANQQDKKESDVHCAFEDLDHSVLEQPLNLGVNNVKQILKCIQTGSREVKDIILNECNIVYECKVCRSLFRSLANFLYHKRCYCKKHCCEEMLLFEHFEENEMVVVQPEPPNDAECVPSENVSNLPECTVDLVQSDVPMELLNSHTSETEMSKLCEIVPENKIDSDEEMASFANTGIVEEVEVKDVDNSSEVKSEKSALEKSPVKLNSVIDHIKQNAEKLTVLNKSDFSKVTTSPESQDVSGLEKKKGTVLLKLVPKNSNSVQKSTVPIIGKGEISLVKFQKEIMANYPTLTLKAIKNNSNAVFQTFKKEGKNEIESSAVKEKPEKEKIIIVVTKKDIAESPIKAKTTGKLKKPSEFQTTRRKKLMNRKDCNVYDLKCLICNTHFTSLKTLYFHMLSLHSKKRFYYPCPFCNILFVQIYGVTRHLAAIHHRTKEQISKLREMIKKRGIWRKIDESDPNAEIKKSLKASQSANVKTETKQETTPVKTIIKLDKKLTLHKCSKCSRVFGRKSSQVSHEKYCIMNAIQVQDNLASVDSSLPMAPVTPVYPAKSEFPDVKVSTRPKRGAEKQMHKDFVNSQTLKWRSANRVDTNNDAQTVKKVPAKNIEKKVLNIMDAETLICLKCDKKFSSFSNLRRHAAIHVGWTRFKCKNCDYQAYNKSQCWAHIQKSHGVPDADLDKFVVHLAGGNNARKKVHPEKQNVVTSNKSSALQCSDLLPKVKFTKLKNINGCTKNITMPSKQSPEKKKEKNMRVQPNKFSLPEYKKEMSNYKSVTTSNPTTIILSKKLPSPTVQTSATSTTSPTSSTSFDKNLSIRTSPRKSEGKVNADKGLTTLVTRSGTYPKSNTIHIKLPIETSSTDADKSKKERLISEWFPKKNLTKRDSAPLIIGLVPFNASGTKGSGIPPENC